MALLSWGRAIPPGFDGAIVFDRPLTRISAPTIIDHDVLFMQGCTVLIDRNPLQINGAVTAPAGRRFTLRGELATLLMANARADVSWFGADTDGASIALASGAALHLDGVPCAVYPATEDLVANQLLNVWDNAGTFEARLSQADVPSKRAAGWAYADALSGEDVVVVYGGRLTGQSGLTAGAAVYTSTTPGAVTQTPTSAPQRIGVAMTATTVLLDGIGVTPSGDKYVQIQITDPNGSAITTGDGKGYFDIPIDLDGFSLVDVSGRLITASSSGDVVIQIANVTTAADVLSSPLTIVAGDDRTSDTASAALPAVIDPAECVVATADLYRFDFDGAGTGAKGVIVNMTFRGP